jgi:hypothetical protein
MNISGEIEIKLILAINDHDSCESRFASLHQSRKCTNFISFTASEMAAFSANITKKKMHKLLSLSLIQKWPHTSHLQVTSAIVVTNMAIVVLRCN